LDLRPIRPAALAHLEDASGEFTDAALARYIAKYATKDTGISEGADRPIHDIDLVAHLDISAHHRRMIETAWTLGGDPRYERLNLRRWAHMLGFRGHFLTKSRAYSTTFGAIRGERRTWRLAQDLADLDRSRDESPGEEGEGQEHVTLWHGLQ
jgi:replication initiator protein RepSA